VTSGSPYLEDAVLGRVSLRILLPDAGVRGVEVPLPWSSRSCPNPLRYGEALSAIPRGVLVGGSGSKHSCERRSPSKRITTSGKSCRAIIPAPPPPPGPRRGRAVWLALSATVEPCSFQLAQQVWYCQLFPFPRTLVVLQILSSSRRTPLMNAKSQYDRSEYELYRHKFMYFILVGSLSILRHSIPI